MSDRTITLAELIEAGYTEADLRQAGVVIRSGNDGELCCDRDDLQAHGIDVPDSDERE